MFIYSMPITPSVTVHELNSVQLQSAFTHPAQSPQNFGHTVRLDTGLLVVTTNGVLPCSSCNPPRQFLAHCYVAEGGGMFRFRSSLSRVVSPYLRGVTGMPLALAVSKNFIAIGLPCE